MGGSRSVPGNVGTPEIREAVRSQIVAHGHTSSLAIASELQVPHATVVRVLLRFAAVGVLGLTPSPAGADAVEVVRGSPTARFRDLSAPLW